MKNKVLILVRAIILCIPILTVSCQKDKGNDPGNQPSALIEALETNASLSEFTAALKAMDLSEIDMDNITILAVKNSGLTSRSALVPEDMLKRHIIEGAYTTSQFASLSEIETLGGTLLKVTSDNGAISLHNVAIGSHTAVGNSVLYVLDRYIPEQPLDIRSEIEKQKDALLEEMGGNADLSQFKTAFESLDVSTMSGTMLTVFAVENSALTEAGVTANEILGRHILSGNYDTDALAAEDEVSALDGTTLVVTTDNGVALLNNMAVGSAKDVDHSVLYVLNGVIPADNNSLSIDPRYNTTRCSAITLEASFTGLEGARFEWILDPDANDKEYTALITDGPVVQFAAAFSGIYEITVNAKVGEQTVLSKTTEITVETADVSKDGSEIVEYSPAPGQDIADSATPTTLNAGAFGGYGVVKFDHTIVNAPGLCDFRIKRNANVCPAVIWVAYDKNNDGTADADEWYEIEGSAHGTATDKGTVTVTYTYPGASSVPATYDPDNGISIAWSLSNGTTGAINNPFAEVKWPFGSTSDAIFTARWLDWPTEDPYGYGYFNCVEEGWGYAALYANTPIDIDWAVDATGNPVKLPGVDFIKVTNAIIGNNGMMGEHRLAITGFEDLHLNLDLEDITTEEAKGE